MLGKSEALRGNSLMSFVHELYVKVSTFKCTFYNYFPETRLARVATL